METEECDRRADLIPHCTDLWSVAVAGCVNRLLLLVVTDECGLHDGTLPSRKPAVSGREDSCRQESGDAERPPHVNPQRSLI